MYKSVVSAALSDKSYPGDNRLIAPNSSHRRRCLAPRCRLISSWRGSTFQGSGCSPVKEVRELGSERRETVRFISAVDARKFEGICPESERTGVNAPLVY